MEGILRVTPDKLISTSSEFGSIGTQVRALTQEMLDKVNASKAYWQGDAAMAYTSKFNLLQDDMERINRMIQEHVDDLQNMAQQYQAAENANVESSNALAADIIQ